MNPGVDQAPSEWGRRVIDVAGTQGRNIPPVSIWHGTADARVVPRNREELVEQWTAAQGISTTPARKERDGSALRELFVDGNGAVVVESVLVEGLAHAFPIRTDSASSCGQPGEFVAATDVCAANEIARFWGLSSRK